MSVLWIFALGPLALLAVALAPAALVPADTPSAVRTKARFAFAAAAANAVLALAALILVLAVGPLGTGTIGVAGIGFAISLDHLSTPLFLLVAVVGAVVVRYSANYLAGHAGQGRFLSWLAMALAAVLVLVLSGNLFQLLLAFIATAAALQRLLLFYGERSAAVLAARKKWVTSRLAELSLGIAVVIVWSTFGTLDVAALTEAARAMGAAGPAPATVHAIAILVVVAALLTSAQFPAHGWLLEVMETPTPVSALLHAGIINAGGFLVLRHADLVMLSGAAMETLVLVGGLTALVGSVVMLTQTSIKVSLAWSTIAQMGFMMLQCGLGAFSAALLHIVAHSLYKAHAFLSSGSVIDIARAAWTPSPGGRPHPARLALSIVLLFSALLAAASLFGATLAEKPGVFALGAILVLGLAHLVVEAIDERPTAPVIGRVLVMAGGVTLVYFAVQAGAAWFASGTLPPVQPLAGAFDFVVILIVVAGFAAITVAQSRLPIAAGEPRWQALYAHVSNGFYVNTIANRLVIRWWPAPSPQPLARTATPAPKGA